MKKNNMIRNVQDLFIKMGRNGVQKSVLYWGYELKAPQELKESLEKDYENKGNSCC